MIPVKNVLFASEMIGAVRGIDPTTGHCYDDTKRYIEASTLEREDKHQIYKPMRAACSPRLDTRLKTRGPDMYELGVVYRNITRADRAAADGLAALVPPPCTRPWARKPVQAVHAPHPERRAGQRVAPPSWCCCIRATTG